MFLTFDVYNKMQRQRKGLSTVLAGLPMEIREGGGWSRVPPGILVGTFVTSCSMMSVEVEFSCVG